MKLFCKKMYLLVSRMPTEYVLMFPGHNQSAITEFFLLGFQALHNSKILLFSSFLAAYILTLTGNLMIMMLVSTTRHLHSPMYFFLSHLSFCDIMLSSTIAPILIQVTLHNGGHFTVTQCLIQFYFFVYSTTSECLLLTVMSYDRYVAVCKPLHYQTIMVFPFCLFLVILSWILAFVITLISTVLLSQLDFCYSGDIDHFFCDYAPIIQLSCSDTTAVQLVILILGTPEVVIETGIIISTYVCIFLAIHRISSTTGQQKAFSTCSSHLAVVCTYFGTLFVIYIFSSDEHSSSTNKIASLIYTVVTPFLNPIIYSLRNQEIKNSVKSFWKKNKTKMLV
uniref:Olfactory receptor n=1 Tax=Leptobrachium leishanense TaxID=445787 RepID=A0A8C5LWI9_9ANUR